MASESLKGVGVRSIFRDDLGFRRTKEGGACLDTGVADEAGVAGNHVFDVASRPMTELTTSLGHEMLSHCLHLQVAGRRQPGRSIPLSGSPAVGGTGPQGEVKPACSISDGHSHAANKSKRKQEKRERRKLTLKSLSPFSFLLCFPWS